jgi:hypothetical protein
VSRNANTCKHTCECTAARRAVEDPQCIKAVCQFNTTVTGFELEVRGYSW